MRQYHDLLMRILDGVERNDRTGTGTVSVFGHQMRFDLSEGFPLITTKRLHLRSIIHELLWFLLGDTNIRYLKENKVSIWDEWADENGDLGPVYGAQWRRWRTFKEDPEATAAAADGRSRFVEAPPVDQVAQLVERLRRDPESRRHLVTAWNPADISAMKLPPCHALWQCYIAGGRLSLMLYQRSVDAFLGLPFNIASYALLTHMLAQQCDLEPGDLVWTGGDCHLYLNHLDQARLLLSREPRPLPTLRILRRPGDLFSYRYEDFAIEGYDPWPHIPAPVAV